MRSREFVAKRTKPVIDMLEEGSRELAKMLEKHPHLLESFEGWDEIQSVVRRLAGPRPVVGNKYCILNLTISPPGKFLIQQGSSEPLELVGINDRGSYLQYEFDAGDRIIQYPEDHRAGDQLSKTFLYGTAQELEKMQNFISLSLSGWEIRNRISENFADGKVKGKSRPGRVKRAGASCKGSVTDLRARAKKYGGERGRMYQWCANMKSGRKKANESLAHPMLSLDPWKFDQSDQGWRSLSQPRAIAAIKDYIAQYVRQGRFVDAPQGEKSVDPSTLYWHLGQLLAMSGDYNQAVSAMRSSLGADTDWNDYVKATIAFLANNKTRFAQYVGRPNPNKETIDRLANNWGKSYRDAY